ncbi:unnamed protein product [Arabidopsis arenosa]|uniref:Uncharacterized protein n=1 Tax=Arabidopsis arenosa TaxID=38785 RepID=A0A8S2B4W8_ARAAE|nr:unnamed protein product [Arabidopsis arenosa]
MGTLMREDILWLMERNLHCLGVPVVFTTSYGDSQGILGYVRELCEDGKLDEVIDPMVAKDMTCCQRLQVEACVVLALRCCKKRDEDRPKMIQVAKELKRIQTSWKDPCYQLSVMVTPDSSLIPMISIVAGNPGEKWETFETKMAHGSSIIAFLRYKLHENG